MIPNNGATGIFKLIQAVRKWIGHRPDHHGSDNWYDFFGCFPYNDNNVKRERRDLGGPTVLLLSLFSKKADNLSLAILLADKERRWK